MRGEINWIYTQLDQDQGLLKKEIINWMRIIINSTNNKTKSEFKFDS